MGKQGYTKFTRKRGDVNKYFFTGVLRISHSSFPLAFHRIVTKKVYRQYLLIFNRIVIEIVCLRRQIFSSKVVRTQPRIRNVISCVGGETTISSLPFSDGQNQINDLLNISTELPEEQLLFRRREVTLKVGLESVINTPDTD